MTYVRTKNEKIQIVIDPNEFDEEERRKIPDNCTMVKANNIFGCVIVENKNIIKQADTIEELIDEKILIEKDGHPTLLETLEFDRNIYLRINEYEFATQLPSNPIIYGAIWSYDSNGVPTLKSVAKMNDKGELELL